MAGETYDFVVTQQARPALELDEDEYCIATHALDACIRTEAGDVRRAARINRNDRACKFVARLAVRGRMSWSPLSFDAPFEVRRQYMAQETLDQTILEYWKSLDLFVDDHLEQAVHIYESIHGPRWKAYANGGPANVGEVREMPTRPDVETVRPFTFYRTEVGPDDADVEIDVKMSETLGAVRHVIRKARVVRWPSGYILTALWDDIRRHIRFETSVAIQHPPDAIALDRDELDRFWKSHFASIRSETHPPVNVALLTAVMRFEREDRAAVERSGE